MILNRKIAPSAGPIEGLEFRLPECLTLSSGARVHLLEDDRDEVCRIEWIFWSGSWDQQKKLEAYSSIKMLPEGAAGRSSQEIAEMVQFYGAFLDERSNHHSSSLILYSLTKYLPQMLSLMREIIQEPDYPEYEFGVMLNQSLQEFRVESEKVMSLARRKFSGLIFGTSHPYGAMLDESDYNAISPYDARNYHQLNHRPSSCDIIAAGKLYVGFITDMEELFGKQWTSLAERSTPQVVSPAPYQIQQVYETKAGALQCAIRMGRPLFSREHEDYHAFSIVNTLLGGYFGSRLMSNLREDKGYTYGVGSGSQSMKLGGLFFISSQVGANHWEDAVVQIRAELSRLLSEDVSDDELNLVRNYLWGNLARAYDGPFARAERLRTYLEYGLGGSDLDRYVDILKGFNNEDVRGIAQKYLDPQTMTELIVGP
jgi:zinc protease